MTKTIAQKHTIKEMLLALKIALCFLKDDSTTQKKELKKQIIKLNNYLNYYAIFKKYSCLNNANYLQMQKNKGVQNLKLKDCETHILIDKYDLDIIINPQTKIIAKEQSGFLYLYAYKSIPEYCFAIINLKNEEIKTLFCLEGKINIKKIRKKYVKC